MQIIRKPKDMQSWSDSVRRTGFRLGLVPTMGYLHDGHLSLAAIAREQGRCDKIAMSIFVNPAQFAPNEDFARYPRDLERDCDLARSAGVDVVFHPDVTGMYSSQFRTYIEVETMGNVLCGRTRPTHFRGVTTVVAKLFNIVKPHAAVFGQKDAQQFIILQRMVHDLNMDVEMIRAPIVREPDGLAMSSRNKYLSPEERRDAVCLYEALKTAEALIGNGETNADQAIQAMKQVIQRRQTAQIDYIEIVDTGNLEHQSEIKKDTLIALAVFIGKTRLIDNLII